MRGYWFMYVGAAMLVAVALFYLASALNPAPPREVRMATGTPGGAYAAAGAAFAEELAKTGVAVELVPTSGSVDNLNLLLAEEGGVDFAILQGGIVAETDALRSIAGLFYEPMWVFIRADVGAQDLRDLRGLRIAGAPEGSGARALLEVLLADNELTMSDVRPLAETGEAAETALLAGRADAVVYVTSPDRSYVRRLLANPDVQTLTFERAEAYGRRHRFLSSAVLPRGVVDLAGDIPRSDVALVAPAANLVARDGLHPAVQTLLLQAAFEMYRGGDVIASPAAFPSRDLVTFPLTDEADRFFDRGGPSFFRRYLPFWAANLVERLWVLIIPLMTLMYPMYKSAYPIYRWGIRRRIIRWYRDLRRLEKEGRHTTDPAKKAEVRAELHRILDEVGQIEVPLPYNDDAYRLRSHIRLVDSLVAEAPITADLAD
ncbi:MAG: ABC transporter substrate-binding protein [Caulobacterales bacterium]|nr:ABC transporter substrate-binding protein [Caulobacterales bacterium]